MEITAKEYKEYLQEVVAMVEKEKDYFCELDRKLGDGDHGVTMSIGWQAVNEQLKSELDQEQDLAKISVGVGKTFLSAVGSSVGPLYATGFMRGAKVVKGKTVFSEVDIKDFWVAFANGVRERGQAKVGDKTMVDTLSPFAERLETVFNETNDLYISYQAAVVAAETGMKSTKDIVSKLGRSSRLGERSLGVQDPGATSIYLILKAFLPVLEKYKVS